MKDVKTFPTNVIYGINLKQLNITGAHNARVLLFNFTELCHYCQNRIVICHPTMHRSIFFFRDPGTEFWCLVCPLCFEKSIPQCLGPSPLTIWKLLRNVCMTCAETHSGHGCFLKSFVPPRLISTRNAKCLIFVCWGLQWCRQAVRGIGFFGFAQRYTAGLHVVADSVEVHGIEVDILTWRPGGMLNRPVGFISHIRLGKCP